MATHSNTLAWRIPWTEKPGGLQSVGSQRVGQGHAGNAAPGTAVPRVCKAGYHLPLSTTFMSWGPPVAPQPLPIRITKLHGLH